MLTVARSSRARHLPPMKHKPTIERQAQAPKGALEIGQCEPDGFFQLAALPS